MFIYLDACALQRPHDDLAQPRIASEVNDIEQILARVRSGLIELVTSEILELEIDLINDPIRAAACEELLSLASHRVRTAEQRMDLYQQFCSQGLKPNDAWHLVSAEIGNAAYLCTCDDRFRKRARQITGLAVKIVLPHELLEGLG